MIGRRSHAVVVQTVNGERSSRTRPVRISESDVEHLAAFAFELPARVRLDLCALVRKRGVKVRALRIECGAEEPANRSCPCRSGGIHIERRTGAPPSREGAVVELGDFVRIPRDEIVIELLMV